jgi:MFS family permease
MWIFVTASLGLMFCSAFLDNTRGPILPLITESLKLNYGSSSWFLGAGNIAGVLCNFLLIPFIKHFQEKKSAVIVCGVALVAVLSTLFVSNFFTLMILGSLLGITIASLGAVANIILLNSSTHEKRSKYMSALHMMYGIGSVIAPATAAFLLDSNYHWKQVLQIGIFPIVLVLFFNFKYLKNPISHHEPSTQKIPLTYVNWIAIWAFAIYVAAEVMASNWMVAYLSQKMSIAEASKYLSGFFAMMGITRMLCVLFIKPRYEKIVIYLCLLLFIFFFTLGHLGFLLGFSLCGVLGPYFPVFISRLSHYSPKSTNKITLTGLAISQALLVSSHKTMGLLTDNLGISSSYYFPILIMIIALIFTGVYFVEEQRKNLEIS